MRDLTDIELENVYGAGGSSRPSCASGSGSKKHKSSKHKSSKHKSSKHKGSSRHGC